MGDLNRFESYLLFFFLHLASLGVLAEVEKDMGNIDIEKKDLENSAKRKADLGVKKVSLKDEANQLGRTLNMLGDLSQDSFLLTVYCYLEALC